MAEAWTAKVSEIDGSVSPNSPCTEGSDGVGIEWLCCMIVSFLSGGRSFLSRRPINGEFLLTLRLLSKTVGVPS